MTSKRSDETDSEQEGTQPGSKPSNEPVTREWLASLGIGMEPDDSPIY